MPRRLGMFVTAAMVLGVLVGLAVNQWLTPAATKDVAANLSSVAPAVYEATTRYLQWDMYQHPGNNGAC